MIVKDYSRAVIDGIEGWLSPHAAIVTQHLIQLQRERDWVKGVLELGVFKGKYLALLAQQVSDHAVPVVGVDAFLERHGVKLEERWRIEAEGNIRQAVASMGGAPEKLTIIAGLTQEIDREQIRSLCPGGYSFISVDAGHDAEDVEHDAELASEQLSANGVIAFDDIFNAVCPGVAEGFLRYMLRSNVDLSPFATSGNKVFVCRKRNHQAYLDYSKALARSVETVAPELTATAHHLAANEANHWAPRFMSFEVVPFL